MGIYDRPYMREQPEHSYGVGRAAWWLDHFNEIFIALNVVIGLVVLVAQRPGGNVVSSHLVLSMTGLEQHQYWTLVTQGLVYQSLMTLLFDMLLLWWFGNELQSLYGRTNLVWIYGLLTVGGGGAYVVTSWLSGSPPQLTVHGSAPLVLGVMVIMTMWFPKRLIYIFGILPCPLFFLTIVYSILALVGLEEAVGYQSVYAPTVAGGVIGLMFYWLDLRISRGQAIGAWLSPSSKLRSLFDRRGKGKRAVRGSGTGGKVLNMADFAARPADAGADRAKIPVAAANRVDALLDKIAKEGKEALTAEELEFLTAASKNYRRED